MQPGPIELDREGVDTTEASAPEDVEGDDLARPRAWAEQACLGEIESASPISALAAVKAINKTIKLNWQYFEKTRIQ